MRRRPIERADACDVPAELDASVAEWVDETDPPDEQFFRAKLRRMRARQEWRRAHGIGLDESPWRPGPVADPAPRARRRP